MPILLNLIPKFKGEIVNAFLLLLPKLLVRQGIKEAVVSFAWTRKLKPHPHQVSIEHLPTIKVIFTKQAFPFLKLIPLRLHPLLSKYKSLNLFVNILLI